MTISQAIETVPDLRKAMEREEIRSLIETAQKLEGMPRHSSVHAAGVVIGKEPLWEYVPLGKTQDGVITTQYPMEALEALGLLKMDFLGLRTLTVIQKAAAWSLKAGETIEHRGSAAGQRTNLRYARKGESLGCSKLESSWVRDFLKR